MGFDAALRTAHDRCSLSHVQFLPVTHQKRLPLTRRQLLNSFSIASRVWDCSSRCAGPSLAFEASALSRVSSGSPSSSSRPGESAENKVTHVDLTFCRR